MRAHIIVSEELVHSVDKLVGPRSRSKFFAEAAKEKLAKIKRAKLAKSLAGSLSEIHIPGWETSKKADEWVQKSRASDEETLKANLHS